MAASSRQLGHCETPLRLHASTKSWTDIPSEVAASDIVILHFLSSSSRSISAPGGSTPSFAKFLLLAASLSTPPAFVFGYAHRASAYVCSLRSREEGLRREPSCALWMWIVHGRPQHDSTGWQCDGSSWKSNSLNMACWNCSLTVTLEYPFTSTMRFRSSSEYVLRQFQTISTSPWQHMSTLWCSDQLPVGAVRGAELTLCIAPAHLRCVWAVYHRSARASKDHHCIFGLLVPTMIDGRPLNREI